MIETAIDNYKIIMAAKRVINMRKIIISYQIKTFNKLQTTILNNSVSYNFHRVRMMPDKISMDRKRSIPRMVTVIKSKIVVQISSHRPEEIIRMVI